MIHRTKGFLPRAGAALALILAAGAVQAAADRPASNSQTLLAVTQDPGEKQQEEAPLPDNRPEVAELLATLDRQVGEKGKEDKEAQTTIDQLLAEFPKSGPKDKAAVVKAFGKILTVARKDLAKDIPDEELKQYTAVMLGRMAPESVEVLIDHVGHRKLKELVKVQRAVILSLGNTKDEKGIKSLLKVLDEPQWEFVAAASEALGQFTESEQKVRKNIFEELLQRIIPLADILETDQGQGNVGNMNDNELMIKEFETIRGAIRGSLEALSKHTEASFLQWRTWWNKNKKADWDAKA